MLVHVHCNRCLTLMAKGPSIGSSFWSTAVFWHESGEQFRHSLCDWWDLWRTMIQIMKTSVLAKACSDSISQRSSWPREGWETRGCRDMRDSFNDRWLKNWTTIIFCSCCVMLHFSFTVLKRLVTFLVKTLRDQPAQHHKLRMLSAAVLVFILAQIAHTHWYPILLPSFCSNFSVWSGCIGCRSEHPSWQAASGGFKALLKDPAVRRPLFMAIILMALQQYSGINGHLAMRS